MASPPNGPIARLGGLLTLAALAPGCTGGYQPDEVARKIEAYYAEQATEENGACRSPAIAAITKRKVLESTAGTTVVRVRYSYDDPSQGGEPDWRQVLDAERPCTGVAERDFTLVDSGLGYEVVEMSPPRSETP